MVSVFERASSTLLSPHKVVAGFGGLSPTLRAVRGANAPRHTGLLPRYVARARFVVAPALMPRLVTATHGIRKAETPGPRRAALTLHRARSRRPLDP